MKLNSIRLKKSCISCLNMTGRDLRRYWLLPAAALLALVLFVLLPDLEPLRSLQRNNPLQDSPAAMLTAAILPVLSSACVFSRLHNRQMAARIHALPLTRNQHFFSHVISGWILSVLPFVILFLIYMYLMGHSAMGLLLADETDYYYNAYFWKWLAGMLVTVTFVYDLSVLAGILAGTVLTHLLLALLLNGLLPAVTYLINHIIVQFWTGFYSLPVASSQLSPVTWEHQFTYFRYISSALPYLLYAAAALIFLLIAWLLYRRVKLEREGESTVFKGFGEFVCVCFGFIGLCAGGLLFYNVSAGHSKELFLAGAAAGGLLFYIAARMIMEKRLQIFNTVNMKKLGVFALCGAIFTVFMVFDLGGFAKRLPKGSETAFITVNDAFELDYVTVFDDPSLMEKLRDLGLALADHSKPGMNADQYDETLFFVYYPDQDYHVNEYNLPLLETLLEGKTRAVCRYYSFDPSQPDIAAAYAELYDDPAYKKLSPLYDLSGDKIDRMQVLPYTASENHGDTLYGPSDIIDTNDINALAEAIRDDFRSMTYADLLQARKLNKTPVIKLELMIQSEAGTGGYGSFTLNLRQNYKRTLQFMKENGYDRSLRLAENS